MTQRDSKWLHASLAIALIGCVAAMPRPNHTDAQRASLRRPGTTLVDLDRGREIYLSRCGACHEHYHPSHLSPQSWPEQIDKMQARAKLTFGDREFVELYLVTLSRRNSR